ncbi:hypothetical protein CKM354_000503600 [Cercospora kikuchii]|uniref:Heme haloperoxidase family profile domain-containing protein n=1 Tax=Cercospora kikuchii TaxID=84275 RepID=A0A9P3CL53_9PEZI|nr:uncharacterized protein CKM354_000503600 [Cercospora kikuchii]GIZ41740.1 hypothetical protein CKM354_000503600 [Cercospora kikuchii]
MKGVILSSLVASAAAFPFVMDVPGVDSTAIQAERKRIRRQQPGQGPGSAAECPFNANHVPAAPVTAQYPYNNAKNGKKGNEKGGYQVPAPGDTAHQFRAPNPQTDIRGPCPGLNVAANHNFLAHDGITTFNELVDAQQNIYNVGYDLANLLALLGLTLTDGDLVTMKLSIGCDATSRTSFNPILTGSEPGLDGHNKFEADTSLTRNDYFTGKGDNFRFNGTLFGMMTETTGGNYDLQGLAKYREQRWFQSRDENPNFYFGPFSLLLFGAASFLYELMPSGTRGYAPDFETISSFFGAQREADGTYTFNNAEQIPPNWTNRVDPYDNQKVVAEILKMYLLHPVEFGGNTADGTFNVINFSNIIKEGKLEPNLDPKVASCLLYMLATERVPSYLNGILTPSVEALSLVLTKLSGTSFANLGCPRPLTK